jgi:hypothetical protein
MKTNIHFLITSLSVFLRMRNVSNKSCRENQNTHFMLSNFFFKENRPIYEIVWRNIVRPVKQQLTLWRLRIACWIPGATNTHWEYIIPLFLSTATVIARKRLIITSRVACIACLVLNPRGKCWDVTSHLISTTFFRFLSNSVGLFTNNIVLSRVAWAVERCHPMTCLCRHTGDAKVRFHSIRYPGARRCGQHEGPVALPFAV